MTGDGACRLTTRHVPSVASPLGSSVGGDAIFPAPDNTCDGAIDAWTLVACTVDSVARRSPSKSTARWRRSTPPKTGRSYPAPTSSCALMGTGLGTTAAAATARLST